MSSGGTTATVCTLYTAQFINYIKIQTCLTQLKKIKTYE